MYWDEYQLVGNLQFNSYHFEKIWRKRYSDAARLEAKANQKQLRLKIRRLSEGLRPTSSEANRLSS